MRHWQQCARVESMQKCSIENCQGLGSLDSKSKKRYFHKGLCEKHRVRKTRHGDPDIVKSRHGEKRINHPLYSTYGLMKARCLNVNRKEYKNYGARGITIDERWLGIDGFTNFCEDMGERPEGMTLDRIDNEGDYSKNNCRWATYVQQVANSRARYNRTGYTGVKKQGFRFNATHRGKHLGCFDTPEEAHQAYLKVKNAYLKEIFI